jgi:paraquat-inducible protein B
MCEESKEELLKVSLKQQIKELKDQLKEIDNKPKTSQAQLKATKKYLKAHPEAMKESKKRYYQKKCQDPEWVAEQSRKSSEKYHKKKNELKQIEENKELINYLN